MRAFELEGGIVYRTSSQALNDFVAVVAERNDLAMKDWISKSSFTGADFMTQPDQCHNVKCSSGELPSSKWIEMGNYNPFSPTTVGRDAIFPLAFQVIFRFRGGRRDYPDDPVGDSNPMQEIDQLGQLGLLAAAKDTARVSTEKHKTSEASSAA